MFLGILVFANASNWLWIDINSKQLGGLAMPWSYSVNTALFFIHKSQKNEKEILLPDAKIKNHEKSVVVLVIGESARKQNFSFHRKTFFVYKRSSRRNGRKTRRQKHLCGF